MLHNHLQSLFHGGILGLSQSLQTLAQIVAPVTGGLLLERAGTWAPGALGSLLMAWTAYFAWRYVTRKAEPSRDL